MKILIATLLFCASAYSQTDSASVRILVTDAGGLAVNDAAITLVNVGTAVKLARTTASDGYALFTPVPAGQYTVEVSKNGFQQTRVNDVVLDVAQRKLVRVALAVASVISTVEVSASAEIVQSEDGSPPDTGRKAAAPSDNSPNARSSREIAQIPCLF